MKLPTASLNFLSRRFYSTKQGRYQQGQGSRDLERLAQQVNFTHTPIHGVHKVLRLVGIDLSALIANHDFVLFPHTEHNLARVGHPATTTFRASYTSPSLSKHAPRVTTSLSVVHQPNGPLCHNVTSSVCPFDLPGLAADKANKGACKHAVRNQKICYM